MDMLFDSEDELNEIYFNGVDFLSGQYLNPSMSVGDLATLIKAEFKEMPIQNRELTVAFAEFRNNAHYGFNANIENFEEARWGIIFCAGEAEETYRALQPLIEYRSKQIGVDAPVFIYQPGEYVSNFLERLGVCRGVGEVEKVPYYLLIIGGPEKIPFRFQYELSGEYGVGRLAFNDSEGYQSYVEHIINYETSKEVLNNREAVFWAPVNRNLEGKQDRPTTLSSSILAQGLFNALPANMKVNKSLIRGSEATKEELSGLFCRAKPPVLLFTASHGVGFNVFSRDQELYQGALVTQEWKCDRPVTTDMIFSAEDIETMLSPNVVGMIHFSFACFSAGTPRKEENFYGESPIIAKLPFMAKLPDLLLRKGALGFIGHIGQAWAFSFIGGDNSPMLEGYERAISRILRGKPIGHALRDQYDRGVQLSAGLIENLTEIGFGKVVPPASLVAHWIERNDARAYCLLGDPGARVRIEDIQ